MLRTGLRLVVIFAMAFVVANAMAQEGASVSSSLPGQILVPQPICEGERWLCSQRNICPVACSRELFPAGLRDGCSQVGGLCCLYKVLIYRCQCVQVAPDAGMREKA